MVVAVAVAAPAAAVGVQEAPDKLVAADSGEERRDYEGSMTAVVARVPWVDQSLGVVGGQDVLDWMKSCAREQGVHVSRWLLD